MSSASRRGGQVEMDATANALQTFGAATPFPVQVTGLIQRGESLMHGGLSHAERRSDGLVISHGIASFIGREIAAFISQRGDVGSYLDGGFAEARVEQNI